MSDARTTKSSAPDEVDAYLAACKHPLGRLAEAVRQAILAVDRSIGEEIKWNAPAFFYTGAMRPFNPKEYRRHLIVFNFYRKDCLRLVFWHGDRVKDKSGFLEGDYPDGRRLASFSNEADLAANQKALQAAVKAQLKYIKAEERKRTT